MVISRATLTLPTIMEKSIPYPQETEKGKPKRSLVSGIVVSVFGVVSALYLFNPGAGVIELIPDNIPFLGNLDEAAATAMLISALAYFGLDLGRLFGAPPKKQGDAVEVETEVVDRD